MAAVVTPEAGDDWVALDAGELDAGTVTSWAVRPGCGAVVTFTGTVRDHASGRPGVELLSYEAYEHQAVVRLAAVADELRRRWPEVGRVALVHRVGDLSVGDAAVVVAVSAPHRSEAFAAASWGIDAVKATVPIWKRETWSGGRSWGLEAQHLVEPGDVDAPGVGVSS